MTGRTFVLVHGGGHGGWCYQRLARVLRASGHEVHTPTLTGFGDRRHLDPERRTTFEVFLTDITDMMTLEDLHDVVLVGHSMGGVVVPRVAELATDRVAQVVWLAAVVCADGQSLMQACDPPSAAIRSTVEINPADGTMRTNVDRLVDVILSDGTPEDRAWVAQRHRDYPTAALTEPGRLSAFLRLGLPTGYVVALQDRTIEPPLARRFADRLPGVRRAEVDAGHDCMISQPAATAAALEAVLA